MFKQLMTMLQGMVKEQAVFDPSGFNDPLAVKISWAPAKGGGASFGTHKLEEVNSLRMEFKATAGAIIFYSIFILAGIGGIIAFSFSKSSGGISFGVETIMPILICLVFVVVGGCMVYFGTAPIVFDKQKSAFWKGRSVPENLYGGKPGKNFTKFSDIHALQLVSERCRSKNSTYYSYELNLVLKDGSRINVVDHGNLNRIIEDAQTISRFLDKPVWNAIR